MDNKEPVDTYKSHNFYHQSFHNDCSTCFSEKKAIRINRESLGENIVRGREEDFIHNVNPLG